MKVTMKTREVVELFEDITEFLKKDVALPKQMIWDLDENYSNIKKIAERFEKHRTDLLKPLNEKKAFESLEDGKVRVKNEYIDEFMKADEEVNEYLDTENELEIRTASRKDVPDTLSYKDWKALKFMCVDEK